MIDRTPGKLAFPCALFASPAMLLGLLLLPACTPGARAQSIASQPIASQPTAALPDAPTPHSAPPPAIGACQMRNLGAAASAVAVASAFAASGNGVAPPMRLSVPCPMYVPIVQWYARFLDGPTVKPLTPKEKAWLAVRNVGDPFNALTILGSSAIAIGSDSHSPYGPGFPGFARNVGVSYTEDITGEFFGTFLIPSIAHQDPHYHREPTASVPHRILHAFVQVAWTEGDNGRGIPNYADLVGFAIDDEIGNLYVPGRATNLPASAARYGIDLALAPTDNLITEFVPDLARRVHFRIVLVQRIIDQVAKTDSPGIP